MEPGIWLASSLLFIVTFFFAMIETALYEFAETKLTEIVRDRDRRARYRAYLDRIHLMRLEAALLGGLAYVLFAILVARLLGTSIGLIAFGWILVLSFLLGRILPRGIGRRVPEYALRPTLPFVYWMSYALLPFAAAGRAAKERIVGLDEDEAKVDASDLEHEIMSAVSEGQKEGVIKAHTKEMIEGIFDIRDADVAEIMTPRTEMVAIPIESSLEEARKLALADGHSRYPVYEGNVDSVIGVLYVKDLLKHLSEEGWDDVTTRDLMREPVYVPETKHIADLLRDLRRARVHIAIVLDEYGGTAGLVTIEDIIEEIVGEIEDEYDLGDGVTLKRIDDDTVEADARVHIDDLNDALEIDLPEEEDFDTVGGFVFASIGRVPQVGESFVDKGVEFTVLDANPRRVNRVKVMVLREQNP